MTKRSGGVHSFEVGPRLHLEVIKGESGLFADVYADDGPVVSLRLDADEMTVTLYEAGPDESRTLWQGVRS